MPAIGITYWQKALREAERELDAARTHTALNAAAEKLMCAKEAMKRLEAEVAPSGSPCSAGAS